MNIIKYINDCKNNRIHYLYSLKISLMKYMQNQFFEYVELIYSIIDFLINNSNKKISINKVIVKRSNYLKLSIRDNKNNDICDVNIYIKQDNNRLYYLENIVFDVDDIKI